MYKICSPAQVDSLCVIHYGSDMYDPKKFKEIKTASYMNKPFGGLWTSPINSSHSWRDWCIREEFRDYKRNNSFQLKFKPDSKILLIENLYDILKLPIKHIDKEYKYLSQIDFDKLSKDYDAIWLTEEGERSTRFTEPLSLYGWDCETVLIFNNKCCYEIK